MFRGTLCCVLAALLLLTGCGRSDGSRSGSTAPATPSNASAEDELKQLLKQFEERTFTATYSSDSGDFGDVRSVQAHRGTQYSRETITLGAGADSYSVAFLSTPDVLAACSEDAGPLSLLIPVPERSCVDLREALKDNPQAEAALDPTGWIDKQALHVVNVEERRINNDTARCYEVEPPVGLATDDEDKPENGVLCWSNDGKLVFLGGVDSTEGDRTLVDFRDSVDDSAFDLPFPLNPLASPSQ
jgi:hypothetical protein